VILVIAGAFNLHGFAVEEEPLVGVEDGAARPEIYPFRIARVVKRYSAARGQRRVVARGTLQGKKAAAIAQEAGCGERHVRTIQTEEATQVLISNLLRPYRENLRRLIPKAIRAVHRVLQAQKTTRSDFAAQMLPVLRVRDLLLLAQGAVEPSLAAEPSKETRRVR